MKKDLVSIIINSHNGSKYIKRSVNSVLNQSYENLEVIFWDNCSVDDTKKEIERNSLINALNIFIHHILVNSTKLRVMQ